MDASGHFRHTYQLGTKSQNPRKLRLGPAKIYPRGIVVHLNNRSMISGEKYREKIAATDSLIDPFSNKKYSQPIHLETYHPRFTSE